MADVYGAFFDFSVMLKAKVGILMSDSASNRFSLFCINIGAYHIIIWICFVKTNFFGFYRSTTVILMLLKPWAGSRQYRKHASSRDSWTRGSYFLSSVSLSYHSTIKSSSLFWKFVHLCYVIIHQDIICGRKWANVQSSCGEFLLLNSHRNDTVVT